MTQTKTRSIPRPAILQETAKYSVTGALLGDVEGDEGAISFLPTSPRPCLPPGLSSAAHRGAARPGLTEPCHLAELCLQHADGVGPLGHVHLVGCLLVQEADEDLLEAFAEMLGDQGIDNGVDTGVGVGDEVGEDAQNVRRVVEGKIPEPNAEDDQVVGQPAEAEQDGHDDDHPGDLPLGFLGLRHLLERIHRPPQVANGPCVSEAEDQHRDDVAEDEGAEIHDLTLGDGPDRVADGQVGQLELLVVAEVRARKNEGECPDEADGHQCISGRPQLP